MSDQFSVIVSGRAELYYEQPEYWRKLAEKNDGPFERRQCSTCKVDCLVGRKSRARLAADPAVRLICNSCFLDMSYGVAQETH